MNTILFIVRKKLTTIFHISITLVFVINLISCNQVKLSESDAQSILTKELNVPKEFTSYVSVFDQQTLSKLYNGGAIVQAYVNNNNYNDDNITLTEQNKKYFLGKVSPYSNAPPYYLFKLFNIEFNRIEGISINKQDQTAIVRFSLKATNVTPFGRVLNTINTSNGISTISIDINNPINDEVTFRKFDKGWEIEKTDWNPKFTFLENILILSPAAKRF